MRAAESNYEVTLQSLVDNTVQNEAIEQPRQCELVTMYKWGCNESSDHTTYKQKIQHNNSDKSNDRLFVVSIVPLQLKEIFRIVWLNSEPSSTREQNQISTTWTDGKVFNTIAGSSSQVCRICKANYLNKIAELQGTSTFFEYVAHRKNCNEEQT